MAEHPLVFSQIVKTRGRVIRGLAGIVFAGATFLTAGRLSNAIVSTPPVNVPDLSRANQPLPPDVLVWDQTSKSTDVPDGQDTVQFVFNFTNVASKIENILATNVASLARVTTITNQFLWHKSVSFITNFTIMTNISWVTNSAPIPVTIVSVRPSCHCTAAQMPTTPWTLPPGANGQLRFIVDLVPGDPSPPPKTVYVSTDDGYLSLMMRINVLPPVIPTISADERARDVAAATLDRQAIFRGDCAKCHARNLAGKYGESLYDGLCAICHDATNRAAAVPDLHALKTPASPEFWSTWIAAGKPGSLMPGFATAQGGPLNDIQIGTLVTYLRSTFPSRVPFPSPQNPD